MMQMLLVMLVALFSPLLGLGLLLWLDHLEETLVRDVAAARRRPAPAPILAVPVREPARGRAVEPVPATVRVAVPEQRVPVQAFSRSETLSLGGSTNR